MLVGKDIAGITRNLVISKAISPTQTQQIRNAVDIYKIFKQLQEENKNREMAKMKQIKQGI